LNVLLAGRNGGGGWAVLAALIETCEQGGVHRHGAIAKAV
jgi:hypothetical protein